MGLYKMWGDRPTLVFPVPPYIWNLGGIPSAAKYVFAAMTSYADAKGIFDRTLFDLSDTLCYNEDTVEACLVSLIDAGYIRLHAEGDGVDGDVYKILYWRERSEERIQLCRTA